MIESGRAQSARLDDVHHPSAVERMLIGVNYHYVRPTFDTPYPGIHGVTPAQLEAQLRLLGTAAEFVSGEQVRDAVQGTGRLPSRAILVTFDDGLREQVDHALPVLERLGIPAMFFVNTHPIAHGAVSTVHKIHLLRAHVAPERFLELLARSARAAGVNLVFDTPRDAATRQYRYDAPEDARLKYVLNFQVARDARDTLIGACFRMVFGDAEVEIAAQLYTDVAQLRVLGGCACVGTHGHEHVSFGLLSRAAVRQSVHASMELLSAWLGYRPYALSYPYGSYEACSAQAGEGAAEAGIEFAFTMERAGNPDLARPLYLARFDCNDLPGGKHAQVGIGDMFKGVPPAAWHRPMRGAHEQTPAHHAGAR